MLLNTKVPHVLMGDILTKIVPGNIVDVGDSFKIAVNATII